MSTKYEIIIADDERLARERLKSMLSDYGCFYIKSEAENGDQLFSMLKNGNYDAAFLDIDMPGRGVFETIKSLDNKPYVVFQTAYSQYGADAFDSDAVDYILKPVSRERMDRCVAKLKSALETVKKSSSLNGDPVLPKKSISLKTNGLITVVRVDEIESVLHENGISEISMINDDKYFTDRNLTAIEFELPAENFVRVSRNGIVNLLFIKQIQPYFNGCYTVVMRSGKKMELSRRRVKILKEKIDF